MVYALELTDIAKGYARGDKLVRVLTDVHLSVTPGEIVWLQGPSGAGKSTLLNIAGLLAVPDAGRVRIAGQDASRISSRQAAVLRATKLGFVFQEHNLFGHLTSIDNIMLPSLDSARVARSKAISMVAQLGLADRAQFTANRLSGGEQKRIAVARALINKPAIVLADEPTAGLDSEAIHEVLAQFTSAANDGLAVVIASHDNVVSDISQRTVALSDGALSEIRPAHLDGIES
ncbi:ABC transporter ATP-binding protein [Micromonospora sp. NPDC047644]|uniref:ABC transporter ATP-binding protein n=1 Tax=Micromonospora sp. NPDC047644 TaxID=3157203 RepID=UPI0034538FD3